MLKPTSNTKNKEQQLGGGNKNLKQEHYKKTVTTYEVIVGRRGCGLGNRPSKFFLLQWRVFATVRWFMWQAMNFLSKFSAWFWNGLKVMHSYWTHLCNPLEIFFDMHSMDIKLSNRDVELLRTTNSL
jgi:hypothetical protein